ncbi:MAG: hypothetical protein HYY20_09730 [Candidatus Tectomicrobia bacterium]|uniref:Uncharacterized protein n=1 Tax=Tectimicrobiota bacterium TaxID=2528274 RepID=A0A932CPI9_UNCTE|nr:hypothetical protein [Candidatus Tectomicrobia bacterium]
MPEEKGGSPEWAWSLPRVEGPIPSGRPPFSFRWGDGVPLPPTRFSRLYLGSEFCQHLIPSTAQLDRALQEIQPDGLALSLLTPYVTDEGIGRLRVLFSHLFLHCLDAEVIVNDWGTLRLLRREYPSLVPVLGRVLNKMTRDLSLAPPEKRPIAPPPASQALRRSALGLPLYQHFLTGMGIQRAELDFPPQGLNLTGIVLKLSLHLPYGYVTTGRACPIGSLDRPKREKFRPVDRCSAPCQEYAAELHPASSVRLFYRGNTVFYRYSEGMVGEALKLAGEGKVDRLVVQLA